MESSHTRIEVLRRRRRVESYRHDLPGFCKLYLPEIFSGSMTVDRLQAMRYVVAAATKPSEPRGHYTADVWLDRGRGATTICLAAALWVTCYGHRKFPLIVTRYERMAQWMLDEIGFLIAEQIRTGGPLIRDFPVLYEPENLAIAACAIYGRIQGMAQRVAGEIVRPDFILIDNPIGEDPSILQSVSAMASMQQQLATFRRMAATVHFRTS